MTLPRRRFLTICAAAALLPRSARAANWQGIALGADVSVTLEGPGAEVALIDLPALLDRIEAVFSLYRPSELVQLNAKGAGRVSDWMAQALALCDRLHGLTGGAFDPTVQPLWRALAGGGDLASARRAIGWGRVRLGETVTLDKGQALTLNGMAQGFAADLVRGWLARRGFTRALVDMGEQAALGGPFHIGIADPEAGLLASRSLRGGRALATSSPRATLVAGMPHILHPRGLPPLWSTVAVEADSAALADGLSTALVFAPPAEIAALRKAVPQMGPVVLVDQSGDLQTV
ncbi:FAD:protein FMN transferase [Neotabrizicola sp. sgz301269]|uniref:FAD:protein FMN transferase n=1 Tax=Neotabrizicola sp. sgz301269 TaxID=3276282 RepID=UPI003770380C